MLETTQEGVAWGLEHECSPSFQMDRARNRTKRTQHMCIRIKQTQHRCNRIKHTQRVYSRTKHTQHMCNRKKTHTAYVQQWYRTQHNYTLGSPLIQQNKTQHKQHEYSSTPYQCKNCSATVEEWTNSANTFEQKLAQKLCVHVCARVDQNISASQRGFQILWGWRMEMDILG